MSNVTSRLEVKKFLSENVALQFAELPNSQVELLVISSDESHPTHLRTPSRRFPGQPRDWYFVASYCTQTGDHQQWGYVRHDALAFLNQNRDVWTVRRDLTTPDPLMAVEFSFFRFEDDFEEQCIPLIQSMELQSGFNRRLELYKRFCMDSQYQDTHPLTAGQLESVELYQQHNPMDNMLYFLSAMYLTRTKPSEELLQFWMDKEGELLQHKLLTHPSLADELCKLTDRSPDNPTLGMAVLSIPKLQRENVELIRRRAPRPVPEAFRRITSWFFTEVMQLLLNFEQDTKVRQALKGMLLPPAARSPTNMSVHDVRQCAPECMQRLLRRALGTVQQRATLTMTEVHAATHFLLESGCDTEEITLLLRPPVMIEYEMEDTKQSSWEQIKQAVVSAEYNHRMSISNGEGLRSCSDVMAAGMCPLEGPKPQKRMEIEQYKKFQRDRFMKTKRDCHARLQRLWTQRKAQGSSFGEKVTTAWTRTPWNYTEVAYKGEKFNPDKQPFNKSATQGDKPKRKRAPNPFKPPKKKTKKNKPTEEQGITLSFSSGSDREERDSD